MNTITLQWLSGRTYLRERDDWQPGDRKPQYQSVPGHRCDCGKIYEPGDKVSVISGKLRDKPHFWAQCDRCGGAMF